MAYSLSWSSELHRAAGEGGAVELQRLLEEGHDPDEKGGMGCWLRGAYQSSRAPLHLAAKGVHLACIRLLLRYGGNPNAQDSDGYTPLHYLCQVYSPSLDEGGRLWQCAFNLLEFGANPRLRTEGGHTPLDLAIIQGNTVCKEVLEENGGVVPSLLVASRNVVVRLYYEGQLPAVEMLWIPESLKSFLKFQDVVLKWKL